MIFAFFMDTASLTKAVPTANRHAFPPLYAAESIRSAEESYARPGLYSDQEPSSPV